MDNPFIAAECARLGLAPNRLATAAPETYSQAGEDLIVESLLTATVCRRGPAPQVRYVEVGANHPVQTSNTYLFYKKYGGRGVLVEADPDLLPALRQARPRDLVVHAAVSARPGATAVLNVARAKELSSLDATHVRSFAAWADHADVLARVEVPNLHAAELMERHGGGDLHYLSVDVEGLDLEILSAIDFARHRPWVVSCEPSAHHDPSNPARILDLMARNGYALAARTSVNMIFLDRGTFAPTAGS